MNDNNLREIDPNTNVQSVGNTWVVCKSKSRIGHVYYFNTVTGESLWNLSVAEIEKVKNNKKELETHLVKSPEPKEPPHTHLVTSPKLKEQPHTHLVECPDPKEPLHKNILNSLEPKDTTPMDFTGQCFETARTSDVIDSIRLSTQITNHTSSQQISNATFPAFINSNASYCGASNNFTALNASTAFNPNAIHGFNPSIKSLNLNNITSMYNPNVWAGPHQILITPMVPSLVNQAQASVNIGYNNIHQTIAGENIATPVLNHYEATSQIGSRLKGNMLPHHRKPIRNFNQKRRFDFNNYKLSRIQNRNDLRTKLSVNRRFQFNKSSPFINRAYNFGNRQKNNNPNFNTRQGFVPDESSKQFIYEETSRLDLTPLKNIAAGDVMDTWFIVVDMDVILNEFKFLNILSDSDPQCHLLIPQHVMSELEHYVASSQDVQARRIQRFLSQQIEHGAVMLAEEPSESEDDDTTNMLLSTCFKLSEENYHLILLTNDSELLNYKDSIPITILTPIDAKILLNISPNKFNFSNTKSSGFKPNWSFKNDQKQSESDGKVSIIKTTNKRPNLPTMPKRDKECSTEIIVSPKPVKNTMDVAIQTDFSDFNACTTVGSSIITKDTQQQTSAIVQNMENKSNTDTASLDNKLIKKRTIQLKRTIPNLAPVAVSKTDVKKNFKWRRRKNPLPQVKETVVEIINPINNKTNSNTETVDNREDGLLKSNVIEEKSNKSISQRVSNTSSASSDVSIVEQNIIENNIVIEETSMSGISNTVSNVDAEIVNTNPKFITQFDLENIKEVKPLKYGVSSPSMEEYLVMKRDEWVSRFIQIMEEALTVVLQHDPPFSHVSLPPPWTIYEAAQCIKLKFNSNNSIKDATFKLSDILLKVSDRRGKINTNIKPSEYMEMYSYGVYLLDTIKDEVNNCEDLQVGVESLKTLLNDIENPNLDNSTHETFTDDSPDYASVQISSETTSQSCLETPEMELSPQYLQNHGNKDQYSLRSSKRQKLLKDGDIEQKPIKFVRNLDPKSSFFTSLKLRKTLDFENVKTVKKSIRDYHNDGDKEYNSNRIENKNFINCNDTSNKTNIQSANEERSIEGEHFLTNSPKPVKDLHKCVQNNNQDKIQSIVVNEPKIIMNFSKCQEFEDRLKNKFKENIQLADDSELDYDEYITEEYGPEDEFDENADHDEGNIDIDDAAKHEGIVIQNLKGTERVLDKDNIKKFKYVIGMIFQEIREAFHAVKTLCENYFDKSKKPLGPKMKRIELRVKVKNASAHITDLYKSLDSMLESEAKDSNNNIEALFRKAGFQDFYINDELKAEYSDTVTKCKNYVEVFLEFIQNILSTLNC